MSSTNLTVERKASVKNGVGRLAISMTLILAEIFFSIELFLYFVTIAAWVEMASRLLAIILVLWILNSHRAGSIKTPWIILIMVFPVMGSSLFLITGLNVTPKKMRKRYELIDQALLPKLTEGMAGKHTETASENLRRFSPQLSGISQHLLRSSLYPVYQDTDLTYYDDAAKGLEAQKEALREAEKFIFMEYHAIEDKESWWEIQDILEERVQAGVEVRVFYDDMGSIGFINTDFVKRLQEVGIQCRVFNPFKPVVNLFLNNRDHRKITVVDGRVGFTGGYNLANEYFNLTHPYGQWKDSGIKITGAAVRSLTVTFLENWNAVKNGDQDDTSFKQYLPFPEYQAREKEAFVQPYADSPLDNEHIGEDVYINMLNKAVNYCWFVTPYLIITDEMAHAFALAAKRGVDVRVITPGIPDKKVVYRATRSNYKQLALAGVRIYEWTPGFCHCKMSIADDVAATCGTINLDYRSLYHHFENGCLYINCEAVRDTRRDFESMFAESREVTEDYATGKYSHFRIDHMILKLFAPLL